MSTTADAVALWQVGSRGVLVALVACFGATLAGCGSSGLLRNNSTATSPAPALAAAPAKPQPPPPVSQSRVALAPIVGAPDAIGKQLSANLANALQRQRVAMAQGGEKPDYTLRGYMVAAKDKAGVKVSYIWDLTDPTGKRANRIQGEEIASGANSREPWSALTPPMMQTIADKTAASLSTSLASLTPTVARATVPVGVGASTRTAALPAPAVGAAASAASTATTGSIPRSLPRVAAVTASPAVIVPPITGAPGDGNSSLMQAMRNQLQQAGIAPAAAGQQAYRVLGRVVMGQPSNGKQSIKIDWDVRDPNGGKLATVTQNNDIQAGTLDRSWGNTASDAAQGAAVKIKALIDEHRASAGGATAATVARSRS